MDWTRNTTKLQFDLTSYCNASCCGCVRNESGGPVQPWLKLTHFDLELWERLVTEDTRGWFLREITLNGNWGDAMMHPQIDTMMKMLSDSHPETSIYIHTNGSIRSTKFWRDFSHTLRQAPSHVVVFAVDGLEDTHSLYRRNTSFSKIIDNIRAFNKAGGTSRIITTLFQHNEHQITEIEELAKEIGCGGFELRHSHNPMMEVADDKPYTVLGSTSIDEYEKSFKTSNTLSDLIHSDIYLDASDSIKPDTSLCPWYSQGEVQISPWGVVYPCCHISPLSITGCGVSETDGDFFDIGSKNSLHKHHLHDILGNRWFNKNLKNGINNRKWQVCKNECSL